MREKSIPESHTDFSGLNLARRWAEQTTESEWTNNRIRMNFQLTKTRKANPSSKSNSRCTCVVTVINYVTIHHLSPFHNLQVCVWKCLSVLQLKRSHADGYITRKAWSSLASFVLHVEMSNKRDTDRPTFFSNLRHLWDVVCNRFHLAFFQPLPM